MPELLPVALKQSSDFAPKLTFAERCAVLALHRKGVSTRVVAAAFKVNRRTITHLVQAWRGYQRVHDEEKAMGTEEFIAKYLTEEIVVRVNETATTNAEVTKSYSKYDAEQADRTAVPSRRATGTAGINYHRPTGEELAHRVDVQWLEADTATDANGVFKHPAGWYWRDLDSVDQFWNGNPEEGSHMTSSKAFNHAKQELG